MPDQATHTVPRIVVGVDGSPGSRTALTWAMNQAKQTGATVEAVAAWQDPAEYGAADRWTCAAIEGDTYATTMVKVLDDTIAEVSDQIGAPVTAHARVVQSHPVEALLEVAADVQLLVIGSRGHGTLTGIWLGSVVVVPHRWIRRRLR